jgi:ubiquinone/menaquinone biosynthesis C-methylase UbiE
MTDQKVLWEKLAKENARYYIHTDKGRKITEKEFIRSGLEDTTRYILNDGLMPKGGTLLEIGCGNGRMTMFLSPLFDKVIGTDISGEMIRQGKERVGRFENVELLETTGYLIPVNEEDALANDCIDVVFSMHVFQHIKEMEMLKINMEQIYRVLKKGGICKVLFQLGTPNSTTSWWSGVELDEQAIRELCKQFTILKAEKFEHGTMWVWLKK